jgi:hypothetical protein
LALAFFTAVFALACTFTFLRGGLRSGGVGAGFAADDAFAGLLGDSVMHGHATPAVSSDVFISPVSGSRRRTVRPSITSAIDP